MCLPAVQILPSILAWLSGNIRELVEICGADVGKVVIKVKQAAKPRKRKKQIKNQGEILIYFFRQVEMKIIWRPVCL